MFVDGLIPFYNKKMKEIDCMLECVQTYCLWSKQSVNQAKLVLFASRNVSRSVISSFCSKWGLQEHFLGIKASRQLTILTRKKSTDFNFPKERLESRYSIKIVYHGLVSILYKIFGSSSSTLYNVYFKIFKLSLKWNG